MVHSSSMRYAAVAVTITTIAFALVAVELFIIIPTAVVAFTPPSRKSAFRSSIIHADDDVSTYHHHRHPLNNVLPLLKRRDIIQYFNNRAVISEDDAFRKRKKLTAAAANSNSDNNKEDSEEKEEEEGGIRLNKVFKATHSRRSADKLIEEGRVTINGRRVHDKGGYKVIPYRDVITLDGKVVTGWEQINAIAPTNNKNHRRQKQQRNDYHQHQQHDYDSNSLQTSSFEYVKYYKPLGVTCTTDLRIKDNIIHSIESYGYNSRHRVYPIGRLDKETSGLILLTSDGRIVNSVLRGERKQPKVYKVKVDGLLDDTHLQRLRVSCFPVFLYLLLLVFIIIRT